MSAKLTQWQVMTTLVRREFLEQRLLFIQLPLGLTLLFIALSVYRVLAGFTRIEGPDSASLLSIMVGNSYIYPAIYTIVAYSLSMLYYFLMTLYQQRKDRSVLFWNSLPVSDAQTISSKLIASVLCYLFYALCAVVQGACVVLIAVIYGWYTGVNGWDMFVEPLDPLIYMTASLAHIPLDLLWVLPAYAWLLLASAFGRQAPFVWAMGPLMAIVVLDLATFADNALIFDSWIARKFLVHTVPMRIFEPELAGLRLQYPISELLIGALLGALLVYAAVCCNRPDAS